MNRRCIALLGLWIFLASVAGNIVAAPTITSFSPTSGKLNTPVTITGSGFASPATVTFNGVASSSVTVSSATTLVATVPLTGATAAVAGGVVYFSSDDTKVYAASAATGVLKWSSTNPSAIACIQAVCYANGVVYAGDFGHTLALDASDGGLLTTLPVGTNYGGPAVVNGAVIIGDYTDGVVARFIIDASRNDATSAAPDPVKLRHHPLR